MLTTKEMPAYVALLRAINVGGTGKLDMTELRSLCEGCGFTNVSTYIQSGNAVFTSRRSEASVQKLLEQTLTERLGKPVGVLVRSAEELKAVLESNPFPAAPPNRVIVFFLEAPPRRGSLDGIETPNGEQLAPHGRHVFVYYPEGQGKSKLKLPFSRTGTGRNLNTVGKLSSLIASLSNE